MKILILDDETAISGFVEINLKRAGHETLVAASGEAALELIEKNHDVDIALLDVMLPGIDGFEVCRRIRQKRSNIGIIMLSAKSQESDKVTGLMIGADDYVPKPFSITELCARVESLGRRMRVRKGEEGAEAEGFRLNEGTRQLLRGGEEIELTQTEFNVLKFFFDNKEKALSREDILYGVWGKNYFGDIKIVDVNIRRVRLKIEDDPANPKHIVAVRGYGYKWSD